MFLNECFLRFKNEFILLQKKVNKGQQKMVNVNYLSKMVRSCYIDILIKS